MNNHRYPRLAARVGAPKSSNTAPVRRAARVPILPAARIEEPWHRFERQVCARRGQAHLGGPGRPDCEGQGTITEVKYWNRPVHIGVIKKLHERARREGQRAECVSASGFTQPAMDWARRKGIALSLS